MGARSSTKAWSKFFETAGTPPQLRRAQGAGHAGTTFSLFVHPAEALPYLAADVLDAQLFEVTRLIADGNSCRRWFDCSHLRCAA